MTGRHVLLFGNGERPPEHIKDLARTEGVELIGIDGGARWILRMGLVPHRVLGDLDSLDERSRNYTDGFGAPIESLDGSLTRNDLSMVVDALIEDPPERVTLTGCLGSRMDHSLAAFQSMARLALAGIETHIIERWGAGHVATAANAVHLAEVAGERAGLFPLTGKVEGVMLSGFDTGSEVPRTLELPFDGLVGVSIVSDPADVHVEDGALLVFVVNRDAGADPDKAAAPQPQYRLGTLERTE